MRKYIYILIILFSSIGVAQDNIGGGLSSMPYLLNPSFYALNELSNIGVVYRSDLRDIGTDAEQKLLFASYNFEEQGFTLGFDINSKTYKDTGFNETKVGAHYVYNLSLDGYWMIAPSLSVAVVSRQVQFDEIFLEDQINITTGEINLVSNDPLVGLIKNQRYVTIGAGAVVHNSYNAFYGLNIQNINTPNQSIVDGEIDKIKWLISLQSGIEIDVNRYNQSILLPKFSYLYLFNSVSTYIGKYRVDLQQRLKLNDFYIQTSQQLNKYDTISFFRTGVGVGVFLNNLEFGFNYNFNLNSNNMSVPSFKTTEFYINFDLSPNVGRYRGDQSFFRHF